MRKPVAAAVAVPVAAALAIGGYSLSALGAPNDTIATQTFTNVVTYTIPTVTQTVTVTQPPPPPPPVCGRTQTGGNLQTFVNSSVVGETLCWSGTYTTELAIDTSGFTLRNTPGLTAVLSVGSTCGSSFCTASAVHGDNFTWQGFDINGGGVRNCILMGNGFATDPTMRANDDTLDHMRIHGCGNDNHEHGVYAEGTSRLHIVDSWIYGAAGYGVQFYPDSDDTLVEYTVIDGNDTGAGYASNVVFASGDTEYPAGTRSERDTIANSLITFASPGSNTENITTSWNANGGVGTGHVIRDSCVYSPGDVELAGDGSYPTLTNITRQDPLYTNRATGNYTLQAGSPCAGKGPR